MYMKILNVTGINTKLNIDHAKIEKIIFSKYSDNKKVKKINDKIQVFYLYKLGELLVTDYYYVDGQIDDSVEINNVEGFYEKIRSHVFNVLFITKDENPKSHDPKSIIYLENLI